MEFAKDNMNIKVQKSFIQLKNRHITISDSPGEKEILKYNIFQVHMACDSSELCLPHQYLMTVKPNLDKNDFDNIVKQFDFIMQDKQKLETSCFVLQFEHYYFHTI